jgi:hypothetical protein
MWEPSYLTRKQDGRSLSKRWRILFKMNFQQAEIKPLSQRFGMRRERNSIAQKSPYLPGSGLFLSSSNTESRIPKGQACKP